MNPEILLLPNSENFHVGIDAFMEENSIKNGNQLYNLLESNLFKLILKNRITEQFPNHSLIEEDSMFISLNENSKVTDIWIAVSKGSPNTRDISNILKDSNLILENNASLHFLVPEGTPASQYKTNLQKKPILVGANQELKIIQAEELPGTNKEILARKIIEKIDRTIKNYLHSCWYEQNYNVNVQEEISNLMKLNPHDLLGKIWEFLTWDEIKSKTFIDKRTLPLIQTQNFFTLMMCAKKAQFVTEKNAAAVSVFTPDFITIANINGTFRIVEVLETTSMINAVELGEYFVAKISNIKGAVDNFYPYFSPDGCEIHFLVRQGSTAESQIRDHINSINPRIKQNKQPYEITYGVGTDFKTSYNFKIFIDQSSTETSEAMSKMEEQYL